MGKNNNTKEVEMEIVQEDIRGRETLIKGVAAALFYGFCSVSSAFVTKALMDSLKFDFPVTIMVVQMIFTILVLESLRIFQFLQLPAYTLARGLSFFWPAFFYSLNSVSALSALAHMNIAMYGVLKRCVPIFTMVLSMLILHHGYPSRATMFNVCLLSIGCIIAGYGDLTFNLTAYSCGLLSNFAQALYLLLVQRFSQHHKMSTVETLQLNCYNSLPMLLLAAIVNGELMHVGKYPVTEHHLFPLVFLLTVGVGMLLNYSLFLCTGLTSALTTSVVGGIKAMAQTILGLVTFGGVSHNLSTYMGIALNLIGGTGYIAVKYAEHKKNLPKSLHKVMSFANSNDESHKIEGPINNGTIERIDDPENVRSRDTAHV